MLNELEVAKVKERWGTAEGVWRDSKCIHWTEHPKVRERINLIISGNPGKDCYQYFIERYFRGRLRRRRQAKRALTLGCGHGELERGLCKYNFARLHEGVDIADGAVAQANTLARAGGLDHLRYEVADLNTIKLPKCTYDVVFGVSSIHHVANLEHLFLQVALSLKPGGYFFLDEYIGPNRLQWTDEQVAIANELLAPLPLEFKRAIGDPRIIKGMVKPATIEEVNAADPSEAIRSADILKLLPWYFDILEMKGYGGTLLQPLLNDIAGHFAQDDPRSMEYLRLFFDREDQLIASGRLQHDFAIIIARRKPTRVEKLLGPKAAYVVSKARAMLSDAVPNK